MPIISNIFSPVKSMFVGSSTGKTKSGDQESISFDESPSMASETPSKCQINQGPPFQQCPKKTFSGKKLALSGWEGITPPKTNDHNVFFHEQPVEDPGKSPNPVPQPPVTKKLDWSNLPKLSPPPAPDYAWLDGDTETDEEDDDFRVQELDESPQAQATPLRPLFLRTVATPRANMAAPRECKTVPAKRNFSRNSPKSWDSPPTRSPSKRTTPSRTTNERPQPATPTQGRGERRTKPQKAPKSAPKVLTGRALFKTPTRSEIMLFGVHRNFGWFESTSFSPLDSIEEREIEAAKNKGVKIPEKMLPDTPSPVGKGNASGEETQSEGGEKNGSEEDSLSEGGEGSESEEETQSEYENQSGSDDPTPRWTEGATEKQANTSEETSTEIAENPVSEESAEMSDVGNQENNPDEGISASESEADKPETTKKPPPRKRRRTAKKVSTVYKSGSDDEDDDDDDYDSEELSNKKRKRRGGRQPKEVKKVTVIEVKKATVVEERKEEESAEEDPVGVVETGNDDGVEVSEADKSTEESPQVEKSEGQNSDGSNKSDEKPSPQVERPPPKKQKRKRSDSDAAFKPEGEDDSDGEFSEGKPSKKRRRAAREGSELLGRESGVQTGSPRRESLEEPERQSSIFSPVGALRKGSLPTAQHREPTFQPSFHPFHFRSRSSSSTPWRPANYHNPARTVAYNAFHPRSNGSSGTKEYNSYDPPGAVKRSRPVSEVYDEFSYVYKPAQESALRSYSSSSSSSSYYSPPSISGLRPLECKTREIRVPADQRIKSASHSTASRVRRALVNGLTFPSNAQLVEPGKEYFFRCCHCTELSAVPLKFYHEEIAWSDQRCLNCFSHECCEGCLRYQRDGPLPLHARGWNPKKDDYEEWLNAAKLAHESTAAAAATGTRNHSTSSMPTTLRKGSGATNDSTSRISWQIKK